jgi:hypothetical protein
MHEVTLPPIPFNEADRVSMRAEDVRAAKFVACLASGIFIMGLCIYITVLITTVASAPLYSIR